MNVFPLHAFTPLRRWHVAVVCAACMTLVFPAAPRAAKAQPAAASPIEPFTMSIGRAMPIDFAAAVTQVTVANPAVADVVVLTANSVVVNAKAIGETDILLSGPVLGRRHLRVTVHQATEERQIALAVKFAEVRRDALLELGLSGRYRPVNGNTDAGTGVLAPSSTGASGTGGSGNGNTASVAGRFASALLNFGTQDITAFIDAQEQSGRARSLAEPTLVAGNREEANFLAGGELPVPISQPLPGGQVFVTIQYRPFGVQLKFRGEVLSDSLIKLRVVPEVSSLDFGNAVLLSGFRIPAIRTRKVETTLDVRPGESLVISGLFNEERESVRTGVPGLMKLPILGALFSSNRWQNNESELLIVVTPELFDPNKARGQRTIELKPDSTKPALEALKKRLPPE